MSDVVHVCVRKRERVCVCVWMADLEYLATGIRLVVDRRKPEANGPAIVNWNYNKLLKKKHSSPRITNSKDRNHG